MAICQANEARGNTTEPKYPQRTHKRIVAVKQGGKKVHREKSTSKKNVLLLKFIKQAVSMLGS